MLKRFLFAVAAAVGLMIPAGAAITMIAPQAAHAYSVSAQVYDVTQGQWLNGVASLGGYDRFTVASGNSGGATETAASTFDFWTNTNNVDGLGWAIESAGICASESNCFTNPDGGWANYNATAAAIVGDTHAPYPSDTAHTFQLFCQGGGSGNRFSLKDANGHYIGDSGDTYHTLTETGTSGDVFALYDATGDPDTSLCENRVAFEDVTGGHWVNYVSGDFDENIGNTQADAYTIFDQNNSSGSTTYAMWSEWYGNGSCLGGMNPQDCGWWGTNGTVLAVNGSNSLLTPPTSPKFTITCTGTTNEFTLTNNLTSPAYVGNNNSPEYRIVGGVASPGDTFLVVNEDGSTPRLCS